MRIDEQKGGCKRQTTFNPAHDLPISELLQRIRTETVTLQRATVHRRRGQWNNHATCQPPFHPDTRDCR